MPEHLPKWSSDSVELLKVFANIRLVVADLDGTLVYSSKSEIYENINFFSRSLKHRYKVILTIATGRTLTGIKQILENLDLSKNTPLVLYNGGLIIRNNYYDVLYKKTIADESLGEMINLIHRYKITIYAYTYNDLAQFYNALEIEKVYGWSKIHKPQFEVNKMKIYWQNGSTLLDELNPIAVLIDITNISNELQSLLEELAQINGISITRSGTSYIEIRPLKSDKAAALGFMAEMMQIERKDILVIGDNQNDIEMLSWAGLSVTVANATEDAKEASDYICSHNVSEGVVEILRLIKNAKRYYYR